MKNWFIIFIKRYMFLIMAGYLRKLVSLEQALKQAIRDLGDEGIKEVTNKSHSHFRKCSDENNPENNIHHKDSVEIDKECLRRGMGQPMLEAHESMLRVADLKLGKLDNASNTLINIGGRIGRLMEPTQKAMSPGSESGSKFSQSEKEKVYKSIKDVEDKILELKALIDKN